jgi:hypothetical protein
MLALATNHGNYVNYLRGKELARSGFLRVFLSVEFEATSSSKPSSSHGMLGLLNF